MAFRVAGRQLSKIPDSVPKVTGNGRFRLKDLQSEASSRGRSFQIALVVLVCSGEMLLFSLFPGQKEPFYIEFSKKDRGPDFFDPRIPRMRTAQPVQKNIGFLETSALRSDNT